MPEPLPPELVHIAHRLCGPVKGADAHSTNIIHMVKQRASRQLQSYLHVLVLRLQKYHTSNESRQTEQDCISFVNHLRQRGCDDHTETDGVKR